MIMKRSSCCFGYGSCFWGANYDEGFSGGLVAEELPLSPEAQSQVNEFLKEYDRCYVWGCPPAEGWTVEDCKRFNRECKRILDLVILFVKGPEGVDSTTTTAQCFRWFATCICGDTFHSQENSTLLCHIMRTM
jgi:hypothetical protein